MNQRVLTGALVMVSTVVLTGGATALLGPGDSAGETIIAAEPAPAIGSGAGSGTLPESEAFKPDVPVRSARLNDDVEAVEQAQPVTIRVADIGLEAPIISVGVDDENRFDVPAADTVGWYRYSSTPGESGASVLAAHVDYGGAPGAFFNLGAVLPGDTLQVEMEDGRVLDYLVTGNTQYDKADLPAAELFRKEGSPVLQLITCGGTFDPVARSYEANVVVTAVPLTT